MKMWGGVVRSRKRVLISVIDPSRKALTLERPLLISHRLSNKNTRSLQFDSLDVRRVCKFAIRALLRCGQRSKVQEICGSARCDRHYQ